MNKFILSFFLSFCFLLNSALPVTHVYFTKMYFKYYPKYSAEEQKLFLIGTVFPDIRYMGDCDRGDTHWDAISLKEVLEEADPFIAGMKFHSYVDIVREDLVVKEGMYPKLKTLVASDNIHTFLKLAEDEYYIHDGSYAEIPNILAEVLPQEIETGIPEKNIRKWHQAIVFLFISNPAQALQFAALSGKTILNITPEQMQIWNKCFKTVVQDELIVSWCKKLSFHFEEEMKTSKIADTQN